MIPPRSLSPLPVNHPGSGGAGLFKIAPKDLPALKSAAAELKLAFYNVDLQNARNVPGFIKAFKRDLAFPDWFGGNLDALNDCLTDFSWRPAPGYIIVLNASESLRANPTSFAALNAVLASAVDAWQLRSERFWVFYLIDEPASGSQPDFSSNPP